MKELKGIICLRLAELDFLFFKFIFRNYKIKSLFNFPVFIVIMKESQKEEKSERH